MTSIKFNQQPVKLVLEDQDISQMIYSNDSAEKFIELINDYLSNETRRSQGNLLIVQLSESEEIEAVVTIDNIVDVINSIQESTNHTTVADYNLARSAKPSKLTLIKDSEDIGELVKVFSLISSGVIAVTNESNQYVGKVTRSKLLEKLNVVAENN